MKLRIVYAVRAAGVYSLGSAAHDMRWLADTCAGGAWSTSARCAVTFASPEEALAALRAAEVSSYADDPLEIASLVEEYA